VDTLCSEGRPKIRIWQG